MNAVAMPAAKGEARRMPPVTRPRREVAWGAGPAGETGSWRRSGFNPSVMRRRELRVRTRLVVGRPSVDGASARNVSGVAEKRLRLPDDRPATLPAEASAVEQV